MRKFKALVTIDGTITKGKIYSELEEYKGNQGCIIITNDSGIRDVLFQERFKEVLEPITFSSQEEFENAVMEVVMKRLNVFFADNSDPWGEAADKVLEPIVELLKGEL